MKDLKVLELFAGIGACSKALTNLGIPHIIVDAVEVDPYAIKSFNAIHGTNFEPQDIKEWDKDIDVDLIMHGSPCQDFSVAGKGAGGDKDSGTRSSLMYETLRIVEKLKPKYVIWENVKNLLSKKHRHNFDAYLEAMEGLGYRSKYQILNAKDYGVPQNRERVFTVSVLGENNFTFPEPMPLEKKLKDVLESEVDEKYYLPDEKVADLLASTKNQKGSPEPLIVEDFYKSRDPREYQDVSPTLRSERVGLKVKEPFIIDAKTTRGEDITSTIRASIYKQGSRNLLENIKNGRGYEGVVIRTLNSDTVGGDDTEPKAICDGYNLNIREPQPTPSQPIKVGETDSHQKGGVYSDEAIAPTMTATTYKQPIQIKISNKTGFDIATGGFHVRKLTPLECWRLMGFSDDDFEKAQGAGISNTQLYKQAGNSIVVDVLYNIFKELLNGKED